MPEKMVYTKIPYVSKPVSKMVFGTAIGSMMKGQNEFELLDAVFASGITTFDTAADYGDSEASLGSWITARNLRDQVVVITKGANTTKWRTRLTVHDIMADFLTSQAKLQTDTVDLYFLHRDDPAVPVGPIVELLNSLHDEGKIGAFGGSNWTVQRIEQVNEYAYKKSLIPFTISSPNYSLAVMAADPCGDSVTLSGDKNRAARDWYRQNQMPIFAYSSLARGFMSGRIKSHELTRAHELIGLGGLEYGFPENFERLRRAEILAEKKGVSVPQIAFAWIYNQPLNIHPITSPINTVQLQQSIAAMHLALSEQEMLWLNLQRETIEA